MNIKANKRWDAKKSYRLKIQTAKLENSAIL